MPSCQDGKNSSLSEKWIRKNWIWVKGHTYTNNVHTPCIRGPCTHLVLPRLDTCLKQIHLQYLKGLPKSCYVYFERQVRDAPPVTAPAAWRAVAVIPGVGLGGKHSDAVERKLLRHLKDDSSKLLKRPVFCSKTYRTYKHINAFSVPTSDKANTHSL